MIKNILLTIQLLLTTFFNGVAVEDNLKTTRKMVNTTSTTTQQYFSGGIFNLRIRCSNYTLDNSITFDFSINDLENYDGFLYLNNEDGTAISISYNELDFNLFTYTIYNTYQAKIMYNNKPFCLDVKGYCYTNNFNSSSNKTYLPKFRIVSFKSGYNVDYRSSNFYYSLSEFSGLTITSGYITTTYSTSNIDVSCFAETEYEVVSLVEDTEPIYQEGYTAGYNEGLEFGFQQGYDEGERYGHGVGYTAGYDEGYDIGYDEGYDMGYDLSEDEKEQIYNDALQEGYDIGFDEGKIAQNPFGGFFEILESATASMHNFFSIEILPNLTLSTILGIFIALPLFIFFLKLISAK